MIRPQRILFALIAVMWWSIGYASTPSIHDEEDDDTLWVPLYSAEPDTSVCLQPVSISIMGLSEVDAETMWRFVRTRNPEFPIEIAQAFHRLGQTYGIRGDVALCQSIVETGWFTYCGGTAVTPDQHNYCGLGVTSLGVKGHSFESIDDGVRAQLQHLYAYACRKPLPRGEEVIDPRFSLVSRGVATTWHDLSGRWAMNDSYGDQILSLYNTLRNFQ